MFDTDSGQEALRASSLPPAWCEGSRLGDGVLGNTKWAKGAPQDAVAMFLVLGSAADLHRNSYYAMQLQRDALMLRVSSPKCLSFKVSFSLYVNLLQ